MIAKTFYYPFGTDESVSSITLHGPTSQPVRLLAARHGEVSNTVFWIKAAADHTKPGFREIHPAPRYAKNVHDAEPDLYADGIILTRPKQIAIMRTADCAFVALHESVRRKTVAVHAGRPAMTPDGRLHNIITDAYATLVDDELFPEVSACIIGSIAAKDFKHDSPTGQKLVAPFDHFGTHAFQDRTLGTLDIPRIITEQLVSLGVARQRIKILGPSTYDTLWLASYRRSCVQGDEQKKSDRNTILVATC